jgi:hypothetical protein
VAGTDRELANALLLLAWQAMHAGKDERTDELATAGVELFRTLQDTGKTAEGLRILGTNAQLNDRFDQATAFLEECHALFRERGDDRTADQLLGHLSHVAHRTGDLTKARELGEASLATARRFDDLWSTAMATTGLGHVELADGRVEHARALFLESADLFENIGNPLYLSWCLEGLAGIAVTDGRHRLASQLCAARDGVLARTAAKLPPMDPPGYQHVLSTLQKTLGADSSVAGEPARDSPLATLLTAMRVTRRSSPRTSE